MKMKKLAAICTATALSAGALTAASEPYDSWIFYTSRQNAMLIDNDGNTIKTWTGAGTPGSHADLLRNGSVLFPSSASGAMSSAQKGGRFQLITWENEVIWDYTYAGSNFVPHHDVEPIYYTDNPDEIPNFLCIVAVNNGTTVADKIVEIKPILPDSAEIVWEWDSWEHRNSSGNDPHLLTYSGSGGGFGGMGGGEWTHANSVSYNYDLDQIIVGLKALHEFVVIDHSTTTEEAAGSTGGTYGMGGDILYRWGQSSNYGGSGGDILSAFHCARWIPRCFPGTTDTLEGWGNALVFNNSRSSVMEIELPGEGDGIYPIEGSTFSPTSASWSASLSGSAAQNQGSVQRLPNGNTFACNMRGTVEELTPDGEVVWQKSISSNRAFRVAYSYIDTTGGEGSVAVDATHRVMPETVSIQKNGAHIELTGIEGKATAKLLSLSGRTIHTTTGVNSLSIPTAEVTPGLYIVSVTGESLNLTQKLLIQ